MSTRTFGRRGSVAWLLGLCTLLASVLTVHTALAAGAGQGRHRTPLRALPDEGLYDLQRDEALGGHTLARHVGRTDAQLAERLRREPQISAASTYTNVDAARETVTAAIGQARNRIAVWEARRGNRPNLVLHYAAHGAAGERAIGRSLARGARATERCEQALVVLRWLEREGRWIVLTSYPEAGR